MSVNCKPSHEEPMYFYETPNMTFSHTQLLIEICYLRTAQVWNVVNARYHSIVKVLSAFLKYWSNRKVSVLLVYLDTNQELLNVMIINEYSCVSQQNSWVVRIYFTFMRKCISSVLFQLHCVLCHFQMQTCSTHSRKASRWICCKEGASYWSRLLR